MKGKGNGMGSDLSRGVLWLAVWIALLGLGLGALLAWLGATIAGAS